MNARAILNHLFDLVDGDVASAIGWIAPTMTDVPPGVHFEVSQAHGVFEHLAGVSKTLVNCRVSQVAVLHRRPK
ncbi:MAG TPA: hypothetical protein VHR66_26520 [Gemmataceae bacterium]|nr:hypothetical protein [Gemmataceae bacterium]